MLTQEQMDTAATQVVKDRLFAMRNRDAAILRKDIKAVANLNARIKNDEVILDCIYKVKLVFAENTSISGLMKQNEAKKQEDSQK